MTSHSASWASPAVTESPPRDRSGALNRAGTTYYVPNFGSGTVSVVSLPGVPGRPTRVTAAAGVMSAKVSWQAPAVAGSEPIAGYRGPSCCGLHLHVQRERAGP